MTVIDSLQCLESAADAALDTARWLIAVDSTEIRIGRITWARCCSSSTWEVAVAMALALCVAMALALIVALAVVACRAKAC